MFDPELNFSPKVGEILLQQEVRVLQKIFCIPGERWVFIRLKNAALIDKCDYQ